VAKAQQTKNPKKRKRLSEGEFLVRLAIKYAAPAWAFLPHTPQGTGGYAGRTADAVAMSLWPSRGLELYGFEVKSSRSDWLRELKDPRKAEAIAKHCSRWYAVANAGVVLAGELPPTWGLIEPHAGGLRVCVEAPRTEAAAPTWKLFAALARRLTEGIANMVPRSTIQGELDAARAAGIEFGKQKAKWLAEDLSRLQQSVASFEERSGLEITKYNGTQLGDRVRLVSGLNLDTIIRRVERDGTVLRELVDKYDAALGELRKDADGETTDRRHPELRAQN